MLEKGNFLGRKLQEQKELSSLKGPTLGDCSFGGLFFFLSIHSMQVLSGKCNSMYNFMHHKHVF